MLSLIQLGVLGFVLSMASMTYADRAMAKSAGKKSSFKNACMVTVTGQDGSVMKTCTERLNAPRKMFVALCKQSQTQPEEVIKRWSNLWQNALRLTRVVALRLELSN